MSCSFGNKLKLTIFGQSHSPAIGMTLEGIPAGTHIDMDELGRFLKRRAPGQNEFSTPRSEKDIPEFISGLVGDVTCGVPLTAIIRNTDTRSGDYSQLKNVPRPGHADLTANIKYGGFQDYAGGGNFSGRMTAPLCVAGGICIQILKTMGISIYARIASIAGISDEGPFTMDVSGKDFPVQNDLCGEKMKACILEAKKNLDSVGGIVECRIEGIPAGTGDPMFDGMENRIAQAVFAVPAVKGIEFGAGFQASRLKGSENNDPYTVRNGKVVTLSNNCGGILGGITNGMPVIFRAAFKPTPSIGTEQRSVNLESMQDTSLTVAGRHDPCIVLRAVPAVEAAAAVAVLDALLD